MTTLSVDPVRLWLKFEQKNMYFLIREKETAHKFLIDAEATLRPCISCWRRSRFATWRKAALIQCEGEVSQQSTTYHMHKLVEKVTVQHVAQSCIDTVSQQSATYHMHKLLEKVTVHHVAQSCTDTVAKRPCVVARYYQDNKHGLATYHIHKLLEKVTVHHVAQSCTDTVSSAALCGCNVLPGQQTWVRSSFASCLHEEIIIKIKACRDFCFRPLVSFL
ncbi:hypothetical protein J6590_088316 [Homalodisca vitripennis]|nr:hypothetical protein J6590_088316 [Homalodisca vitripennis]